MRRGVLAGVGAAAAAATLAGGWLTARTLLDAARSSPPPERPAARRAPAAAPSEPPPARARLGTKSPAAWCLPVYPGAFDFHSLEPTAPERGNGSAAFSLRRGSAEALLRFYARELERQGWRMQSQGPAQFRPEAPRGGRPVVVRGVQARWRDAAGTRELALLALDTRQPRRAVQAVLSWSPVRPDAATERSSSPRPGP